MIKTKNLIPNVYYDESRDFQVLGRLFDIVANYTKTNIDIMMAPLYKNLDNSLVSLLMNLVGFNSKHHYNNDNSIAICKSLNYLIKQKGTINSINNAVKILLNCQGIKLNYSDIAYIEKNEAGQKTYNIIIYIPDQLSDIILLEDLMEYILPAGWTYRFITTDNNSTSNTVSIGLENAIKTDNINSNIPQITKVNDNKINEESKTYVSVVSGRKEED